MHLTVYRTMYRNQGGYMGENARNYHIDLLKTLAILGVITIHTSNLLTDSIGSIDWLSSLFWGTLTRSSVPIFLMCSGVLFLSSKKEVSISRLYAKYILRIVVAMLFWAMFYQLYHLIDEQTAITGSSFLDAIKNILMFRQEFHLYYLHIILLVYAFLPITKTFVQNASRHTLNYFLIIWFALGIVYPSLKPFWPLNHISGIPVQWLMNMSYAAIGYFVLGFYIAEFRMSLKKSGWIAIFCAGFAIGFLGTWYMSVHSGSRYLSFLEGMSIGVCFMAIGIFGLIMTTKPFSTKWWLKTVTYVSKASFCIYLIHVLFIYLFAKVGITIDLFPNIISVPMVVLLNMACSITFYFIISKVPILNRWII